MKFTIRDLFLVTVIVALVLGWCVDHWRMVGEENTLVKNLDRHKNAMDFLLAVRKGPDYSGLSDATNRCFVAATPASNYESLFAMADRTERLGAQTTYEFWCEGKNPAVDGDSSVLVVVAGDPPAIVRCKFQQILK